MYNLDINFLRDRQPDPGTITNPGVSIPPEISQSKIPLYVGLVAGVGAVALGLGGLFLANQQKATITEEIQALDAEIAQLESDNAQLTQLQAQLDQTRENRQALVSVFNQIKPVSAILQDISDQVPSGIQINSVTQEEIEPDPQAPNSVPPIKLRINGIARSFTEVNDFLLILQTSEFLNANQTNIISAQRINNPTELTFVNGEPGNIDIELPEVIQFNIETMVTDVPASEMLQLLQDKGATGLVTRINTLKEKGAIEP